MITLGLLAACGGSSGSSAGYTLRFETLTTTAPSDNAIAAARIAPFGDGLVAFSQDVSVLDGAGGWVAVAPLDYVLGGTVLDGTIYALTGGGLASSTDGTTFTPVSDRPLTGIAAVGGSLLGLESVDSFSMQVVRSTDHGATWEPTGVVVTRTILEVGSFTALFVGTGPDVAYARFTADLDLGDNVEFSTEVWELGEDGTGERIAEDFLDPVPVAVSADGIAVVDLGAAVNTLNEPYHRTTLAYAKDFDPGRAIEDYTRVHYVSGDEPIGPIAANPMGLDADGHLIVAAFGGVQRSTTPIGPDGDVSDEIALGPGCDRWVDRAEMDDDQPPVTVINASGETLRIRAVDPQNRWTYLQDVADGSSAPVSGLYVRALSLLMAVGADGTCFGVYQIPDKDEDLEWTIDTRR